MKVVAVKVSDRVAARRVLAFARAVAIAEDGDVALLWSSRGVMTVSKGVVGYETWNATLLDEPPWADSLRQILARSWR